MQGVHSHASCWATDELEFVVSTRLMGAGDIPYAVSWNRGRDMVCLFVFYSLGQGTPVSSVLHPENVGRTYEAKHS